ncbi:MAG: alpha-glucan family phosphorylase [Acidobacteriota bacterium]
MFDADAANAQIPTLHISEIELPREFGRLYELAYNLWWTWTPEARDLFAAIDREKWGRYRNPVELLINVHPRQWFPLHEDERFCDLYRTVVASFDRYMKRLDGTWFDDAHGDSALGPHHPVAYFSMEYGLHQSLAIYSGGLGVLSGDHCKSASDLGVPFVAIGLLYRLGYFMQAIDAEGLQQHIYPEYDFTRLPLRPVDSGTGRPVDIELELPGRSVSVRLWLAQIGRIPLLLLDTDLPQNDPADRPISNQLYVRGREMRLLQEMVLGMGGVRALEAVGIEPAVWHLNEGHSALLQLERLRAPLANGASLEPAIESLKRSSTFTTHTPVPAGNEQFDPALIRKYFAGWCQDTGVAMERLLALGRAHSHDSNFNLTAFAIRTSSWQNGVSELNAEVASDMWRHLFDGEPEQPIVAITNGVHARTWVGPEMQRMLRGRFGDWERRLVSGGAWEALLELPDDVIWQVHLAQKARLGRFVRSRLREQSARHGASPDELRAVVETFHPDHLTIGFARRFATYKRANLVFSDIHRLERLLSQPERPVQLLFAGKAHPADRPGQRLIQHIFELSHSEAFRGKVTILENYDMRMGRMLVQGVDVWLNTPLRPMEASGTSGQKVAMNGGLNFSIADGWWPEGFDGHNGWVIGNGDEAGNDRDRLDAESLYAILEQEILPLYFERDDDGVPRGWIERMRRAMGGLTARFSASRMVADYTDRAYLPAAQRWRDASTPAGD